MGILYKAQTLLIMCKYWNTRNSMSNYNIIMGILYKKHTQTLLIMWKYWNTHTQNLSLFLISEYTNPSDQST